MVPKIKIINMNTKSAMAGRFNCYVCEREHIRSQREHDRLEVPEENTVYVFARGLGCKKDMEKMTGMVQHRSDMIFYGHLHDVLDSYRQQPQI
jgi:hypothetical protein